MHPWRKDRILKLWVSVEENCTIRVAKTKALISNCTADLCLCLCISKNLVFSCCGSNMNILSFYIWNC